MMDPRPRESVSLSSISSQRSFVHSFSCPPHTPLVAVRVTAATYARHGLPPLGPEQMLWYKVTLAAVILPGQKALSKQSYVITLIFFLCPILVLLAGLKM